MRALTFNQPVVTTTCMWACSHSPKMHCFHLITCICTVDDSDLDEMMPIPVTCTDTCSSHDDINELVISQSSSLPPKDEKVCSTLLAFSYTISLCIFAYYSCFDL